MPFFSRLPFLSFGVVEAFAASHAPPSAECSVLSPFIHNPSSWSYRTALAFSPFLFKLPAIGQRHHSPEACRGFPTTPCLSEALMPLSPPSLADHRAPQRYQLPPVKASRCSRLFRLFFGLCRVPRCHARGARKESLATPPPPERHAFWGTGPALLCVRCNALVPIASEAKREFLQRKATAGNASQTNEKRRQDNKR